jgi:hypothetical protein
MDSPRAEQGDAGQNGRTPVAVTFADLVFAHHLRQTERYRAAQADPDPGNGRVDAELQTFDGPAEALYEDRLQRFEQENGRIVRAYWCTYQISGLALTEERVKLPWWRFGRTETRIRMHGETEWATRDSPELAHQLHKIDNLAVRVDEVLRGTGEYIAMQLLMAAARHVLSYVDRKAGPPRDEEKVRRIVKRSDVEIADIRRYYRQAASNASRIVYAGGMLYGTMLLTLLAVVGGLVLWAADAFQRAPNLTWTLFVCIASGGVGAALSVLLRMGRGNFTQDYEVGRKVTRKLGMARPFVGAAFAVLIFLGLKSGLVDLGVLSDNTQTVYFYAVVGFAAGFSERWARVLIGKALGTDESEPSEERREAATKPPVDVEADGDGPPADAAVTVTREVERTTTSRT